MANLSNRNFLRRFLSRIKWKLYTPPCFSANQNLPSYTLSDGEYFVLTNTTNNIIRIKLKNKTFYFRECRRHTDRLEFALDLIEDYFDVFNLGKKEDKNLIVSCLNNKNNLDLFFSMGFIGDKNSLSNKFVMSHNPKLIGLSEFSEDDYSRIRDFLLFVWGEIYSWNHHVCVKKGRYQTINSSKQISTKIVADFLGISDLIPNVSYCFISINGKKKFGTIMEEAPGICPNTLSTEQRKSLLCPYLLHNLEKLNVLDALTREKDHRPCNYNIYIEKQNVINVCAFDNDSASTFEIGGISFSSHKGSSPILSKRGKINRPAFDVKLKNNILSVENDAIRNSLKKHLNSLQLSAFIKRLKSLKKALRSAQTHTPSIFIDDYTWSNELVNDYLNCSYGKTYLNIFIEDNLVDPQPWLDSIH